MNVNCKVELKNQKQFSMICLSWVNSKFDQKKNIFLNEIKTKRISYHQLNLQGDHPVNDYNLFKVGALEAGKSKKKKKRKTIFPVLVGLKEMD